MGRFEELCRDSALAGRAQVLLAFRESDGAALLDAMRGDKATGNVAVLGEAEGVGAAIAVIPATSDLRAFGARIAGAAGAPLGLATNQGRPEFALEALIQVALEGLRIAVDSARPSAVHSEMYEFAARGAQGPGAPLEESLPPAEVGAEPIPLEAPATGRAEADDPFAYMPEEDVSITPNRAAVLTNGIAPAPPPDQPVDGNTRAGQQEERRIKKLLAQLEESEREVERLRSESEGDQGLPSKYRGVQGLTPDDPDAEAKRGFLDMLFREQANPPESSGG